MNAEKIYAEIYLNYNGEGLPISAEWVGTQKQARIHESIFWEWYTEEVDNDGIYEGLEFELCNLALVLKEYNTRRWYWVVEKL